MADKKYTKAILKYRNAIRQDERDLTDGQHDFLSILRQKVVAAWADAKTPFERVAKNAAMRSGARGIEPQWNSTILQVLVQLPLRDARFKYGIGEVRIDLENPVHAAEVDHHIVISRRLS